MADRKLKAVLWVLGGVTATFAIVAAVGFFFIISTFRDVGAWLTGTNPPERVEVLADVDARGIASGRYALILDDFVTGSGPRLISDPAELEALRPQLWYLRESHAGTFVSTSIGLTMGMPPYKKIGTLLHDGVVVEDFNCLSVICRTWPDGGADNPDWGLGGLRGAPPPGAAIERISSHFENYDAYLIAHKSIAADPTRLFASAESAAIAPPDTGMRNVYIDLPSELVTLVEPATSPPQMVPQEAAIDVTAQLTGQAKAWIGEGPGNVVAVRISDPAAFQVRQDHNIVTDAEGRIRTLPGLGWRDRSITIEVPEDRLEEVTARIDTGFAASPDTLRLNDATHSAFVAWGLDASCLPGCGGADMSRIITASSFMVAPRPSWTIETWRILPDPNGG